jgi:hypothetical protein
MEFVVLISNFVRIIYTIIAIFNFFSLKVLLNMWSLYHKNDRLLIHELVLKSFLALRVERGNFMNEKGKVVAEPRNGEWLWE